MSNNHLVTKSVGNLRGISTASIFIRPPNVADIAENIQLAPDGTLQIRRGYQCQISTIGGMGNGTFDDPITEEVQTVTIGLDGFLYNKLTRQIYFIYDGQVMGNITAITNPSADLTQIQSVGHGLSTGTIVILRNIGGAVSLNNKKFTITVVDANDFILQGVAFSTLGAYTSGGTWSIAFADQRYLTFSIFTDPRFLVTNAGWSSAPWSYSPWGAPSGQSITCNIIVNRAAQVQGTTGTITAATQANPCQITDDNHNLSTGMIITIKFVNGMTQLNGNSYTVTVIDDNNFTLNVDSTLFSPYISGGTWTLNSGNVMPVAFGHELEVTDVMQFYSINGIFQQSTVLAITANSVTFSGYPAQFNEGEYVSQLYDIPFRVGFDVISPYIISTFIATITDPVFGIHGLQVSINGLSDKAAAFLQIIEPIIIDSNSIFTIDYWYWEQVNYTMSPPFPGSANTLYQNSQNFENAAMAAFDDVIYITNGLDFPQKYDGQTVYRVGMPVGIRPISTTADISIPYPFMSGENYQYAITYEQIDNRGHIVEGEISEIWQYNCVTDNSSTDVTIQNLINTAATLKYPPVPQSNWNTNYAIVASSTTTSYGPDLDGYYYDLASVNAGYTLKIGDSAYYQDNACAVFSGVQTDQVILNVNAGHNVVPGDIVYFLGTDNVEKVRQIFSTTLTSITIEGTPVSISDISPYNNVLVYKTSLVFGDVAIVNGDQNNVNVMTVLIGHTIQIGDIVEFIDAFQKLQRRNIINISSVTITFDGVGVTMSDKMVISSINQRTTAINLQRNAANPAVLNSASPISNNLRINIYRTTAGSIFLENGNLYLVASIPNDGSGAATQIYVDEISDTELANSIEFDDPDQAPNPPLVAKYCKAFGNQLFYAGGQVGVAENSDRVFFSGGNAPEIVPLASNFFNVPNVDDDITGLGVSGTTFVTTKNHSMWAATGNFLSGQIEVVQIAPGTNIGCVAHATIASVGMLMYFVHTNGVYAITENQIYPTDEFGNPIPLSLSIDTIFRETPYIPSYRYVFKRAVAINYTKDKQYLLYLPCENTNTSIRTANQNSVILSYDYEGKNWFPWNNMNAAGGMVVIDDNLYFQERRYSAVNGNVANLYKQHRFYRLVDHADHAGPQYAEWRSSWEDLGQPEIRKKFCRCILLMDRLSDLLQFNNPQMNFSSYINRIPNLQNTISTITQTDNIRNSSWSYSGWGWNYWSGYQDSFITINLKGGTVAKSMQVGFTMQGINMDMRLAGFQLECIPENRKTVVR